MRADGYQLFVISLVGLTAIVGIGLNVLLGLTGQISLGHVAFYAIGAYTVGILTTRTALGFWLALPLGDADRRRRRRRCWRSRRCACAGRISAMVTIAFGFVVEQGAAEWSELTGGWNGISGIPAPRWFGADMTERATTLLVLAVTTGCVILYALLGASPWGRAMRALRDSETASQSIGLDPVADPHHGLRALGGGRRTCRRHVRLDQQFHQPGVVSVLPVDPVPAGRDDRRRRARDGSGRRRDHRGAAARGAVVPGAVPAAVRRPAAARGAAARARRLRRTGRALLAVSGRRARRAGRARRRGASHAPRGRKPFGQRPVGAVSAACAR